jgi:hypothetical protein
MAASHATHDPARRTRRVASADAPGTGFPIRNLPPGGCRGA